MLYTTGSSTATAYLDTEVLGRPNLTIATSMTTEKILFTRNNDDVPRASGVQLCASEGAPRYVVRADRGVILSAGAIGSPQILMLSGIGPAAELARLSIPLIRELPQVGQNLFDVRVRLIDS